MTTEQKQIEFLNRLYVNIENFKSLRFKLPITIGGFILTISGFVVKSPEILDDNFQRFSIILIITIIGVGGLVAYRFVHNQYKDLAEDIHHVWQKLGMTGDDFLKEEKSPGINPKQMAPQIFKTGYWTITLLMIIGIAMIYMN